MWLSSERSACYLDPDSMNDCRIITALILSAFPFTCRSFFFMPPVIMVCLAMLLVKRSSTSCTFFSGKAVLSSTINFLTSGAISESSFRKVLGIPITNSSTVSFCAYALRYGSNPELSTVSNAVAIMRSESVTARPVRFFP